MEGIPRDVSRVLLGGFEAVVLVLFLAQTLVEAVPALRGRFTLVIGLVAGTVVAAVAQLAPVQVSGDKAVAGGTGLDDGAPCEAGRPRGGRWEPAEDKPRYGGFCSASAGVDKVHPCYCVGAENARSRSTRSGLFRLWRSVTSGRLKMRRALQGSGISRGAAVSAPDSFRDLAFAIHTPISPPSIH